MTLEAAADAAEYVLNLCNRIAGLTDDPNTITRLFLSPATHAVHTLLRAEMRSLGMHVRTDAAGNLRGLYPAATPGAPTLLLGSHIDTVPNAGAFDGILGVTVPLALIRSLAGRLPYAIELIAFSEEEGIRFRMPFIGSRAVAGSLTPADLTRTDSSGLTIAQALEAFDLDPADLHAAQLSPGTFAFLELHIEQGPVLESLNLPLGVVTAVAGQSRHQLTFHGHANHAGTTPMHLRQDALAAAAAFITAAEQHANAVSGLVATVGTIAVTPGAPNVIPGIANLSLDVRHPDDSTRAQAVGHLLAEAHQIAASRSLTLTAHETSHQPAIPMNPQLIALLSKAVASTGTPPHLMVSGAGHDAMILASRVPAAMLFVRTPGGLSHHPDEAVSAADVQLAVAALSHALEGLASTSLPQSPVEDGPAPVTASQR